MGDGVYLRRRPSWRDSLKFWLLALILCIVAAGVAIGIKYLWDAVYVAKYPKNFIYQDVPPQNSKDGTKR